MKDAAHGRNDIPICKTGSALSAFYIGLIAVCCAVVLGVPSTSGSLRSGTDRPHVARNFHSVSNVFLVNPAAPGNAQLERLPTLRPGDGSSRFSESAREEELDGDDDDPIVVPYRPIVAVIVPYQSCLIGPELASLPSRVPSHTKSFLTYLPLRC